MTLEQLEILRRAFEVDASTVAILRGFHKRISPQLDEVVDEFGAALFRDERMANIMSRAHGDMKHWKRSIRVWLESVLSGPSEGEPYLSTRFRIGDKHVEAELPQDVVLSAMAQLRQKLLGLAFEDSSVETSERDALVLAICKAVDLEVTILLEGYRHRLLDRLMATERLSTIGQLVASIGHELRNPLSTIETSAYLLLQKLTRQGDGQVDAQLVRHLDKIRHQVKVATKTVSDLLELAKNRPPRRLPIALSSIVDTSMDGMRAPDAVSISIDISPDIIVHADADQLRIVVVNLISNALDALSGQGKITISGKLAEGGVSLRVADDGPGIAGDAADKVFQALFTTKPNGNGLGLPLCRRIAEAHGGYLLLEPVSRGACFHLWLPEPEATVKALR
jgi:signal transduction histidine kinase